MSSPYENSDEAKRWNAHVSTRDIHFQDGFRTGVEAAARVVEKFVHTRRDCEAGTTTEDIAELVRALVTEPDKQDG